MKQSRIRTNQVWSHTILKYLPRRHFMARGKRLDSDKNTFKLKKKKKLEDALKAKKYQAEKSK